MGVLDTIFGHEESKEDVDQTQFYFATDLHGSNKCFKKLLNTPSYYDIDTIIIGGDLSGKAIIPIIETNEGWEVQKDANSKLVENEEELAKIEKQIADSGDYTERMTPDRLKEFNQNTDLVDEKYRELRLERLDQWIKWTEEKLEDTDVELFMIGGNDDHDYMIDRLQETSAFEFVENRVVQMDAGHQLLGYGWSNPTPWDTPREKTEEKIETDLEDLAAEVSEWKRTIVNFHCPPYDTEIDSAPKLDENLKPQTSGGEVLTEPVGSTAIRSFIEQHQPLLGLHGHIHESQGKTQIGDTVCINPGSEYSSGFLSGAIVSLSDESVEQHQFTSG